MGDQRNFGYRSFRPNRPNQYNNRNPNPFVNAPSPPFPLRLPPTNIPSVPPLGPFSPPSYPRYPPQPSLPPSHGRSMNPTSWDGGPPQPTFNVLNQQQPFNQQLPQENAQEWIDRWTKNRGKSKTAARNDIKIYTVKEKLDGAIQLVRELENSSRTLGVMVKTVSSAEWKRKCDEVEEKKAKLLHLFKEIKLPDADSKLLKEKLLKRRKKRARLRRRSDRLKRQKEEDEIKEQNRNFQIDNWQKEMQEEVERVKREEELKKEADAVLWGVTQKKTEAKRQVAMLSALLTLRSVRVARLTAAGLPMSQSQIDTFNTVIGRLKGMWSRQLEECLLEERTLRGMLGVDGAAAASDPVKTHRRLVLNEWEAAIFGSVGALDHSTTTGDQLVEIRWSWDRFAFRESSLLASAVPPSYVLPVPPSSDQWKAFLKY